MDPKTGEVKKKLVKPQGTNISGPVSDGGDQFFCRGGKAAKVRVVKRADAA
jgi:hypothetical protein